MKFRNKIFIAVFIAVSFFVVNFFAVNFVAAQTVAGQKGAASELVKCGRAGEQMCTLCDLIRGLNYVMQYIMKIAIGVGLLAITIGGVMYVVSAGDKGMIDQGKGTMKNAGIGFVIIFAGWLIINTTISYIGSKTSGDSGGTLGIHVTSWGQFECNANPNR